MRFPRAFVLTLATAAGSAAAFAAPASELPAYRDATAPVELRVADLLGRLTPDEKLALLGGDREFYIRPIPRLGLPEIKMADGPVGVRNYGPSTAYPATVALAATWSTSLAEEFGAAMGRDCRARGVHILLAPGVNIQRVPHNGRNFEYLSEDPLLSARLGVPIIRGLQAQGVVATVKHYAANNQEADRMTIDPQIDERTLREIYLPPFEAAIDAGVWAVMSAYNRLNGPYATAHDWLNNRVLKGEWGFRGVLMSDWGATHDTLGAARGGLDLEMPSGEFLNAAKLQPLLDSGAVPPALIDDKVRRILRLIVANGFLDRPQHDETIPADDPRSAAIAARIAREGTVLLKNEGVLPLDRAQVKRIVVLGPTAALLPVGGGSSRVHPFRSTTLVEGLRAVAGDQVEIDFLPGAGATRMQRLLAAAHYAGPLREELFAGTELQGEPVATTEVAAIARDWSGRAPAPTLGEQKFSARWTGTITVPETGDYTFMIQSDDGSRVFLDDREIVSLWGPHALETKAVELRLTAGATHRLRVEYFQNAGDAIMRFGWGRSLPPEPVSAEALARIRTADAVVLSVGYTMAEECEGYDRTYELPEGQEEIIRAVTAANPHTIVVLHSGGAVATERWIGGTRAFLQAWFPGQDGGRAVAEILFGDVNPSGKLPFTYDRRWEESAAYGNYPGVDKKVHYAEGIFVGYRWADHRQFTPVFPFGHGLSYTTFRYDALAAERMPDGSTRVTFTVTNTGLRAGAEVAQIYVAPPASSTVPRAMRELKGFARVELAPGETKTVSVELDARACATFDPAAQQWKTEPGRYTIAVGASSRDLRQSTELPVP